VSLDLIAAPSFPPLGWLLAFGLWFVMWIPLVALLEYGTHRWIQHRANRLLDENLAHLKAHRMHHRGANDHEYVDMTLQDCLMLTGPFFFLLAVWGLAIGSAAAVAIPTAALLAWCLCYSYLWTRVHRAIHGVETNWFVGCGRVFRFYRYHHLTHHVNARVNFGALFPWTDYLLFTWCDRKAACSSSSASKSRSTPASTSL
jgi:hypothetical protein